VSKTQYYCATTLDGYIADPEDGLDWLTGYQGTFEGEASEQQPMSEGGGYDRFYDEVGALVSGSVTYEWVLEHFADPWPYPGKPWWVLSARELSIPAGDGIDVRVTDSDVADLHDDMLRSANGRNLWVMGGGGVASQVADAGLLDELLLTVVPVVLAQGKQLFDRPLSGVPLKLLGTRTFQNGMVELRYEVRR
jgi:dihydrofolate reductase